MSLQKLELPTNGIYLYESRHAEGDVVQQHHHDVHQMLYGLDGEGEVMLDGCRHPFGRDNVALIVPYGKHTVVSGSKLTLLVLAFDQEACDSFVRSELLGNAFPLSVLLRMNTFNGGELRRLLRKMLYEQSRGDPLSGWAIKLLLQELLLALVRTGTAMQRADANLLRAERIRTFIDTHYFEPITTADLASRMNISIRYVNNVFKDRYQMTPMQYLTEVRVDVACRLLEHTGKGIASVCFEVGYENLSTFYRAFKQITGESPNQYRQAVSRGER
jgi:AraC-like DNA-binding protein